MMKLISKLAKSPLVLIRVQFVLVLVASQAFGAMAPWSYDPGPDVSTEEGRELIDINAEIPNLPEISLALMGEQKYRPAYGPVLWRMRHVPNSVKILFIGQDATHIAEAAGRTATAGFGGRAQDLAAYFGVNENAAFINAYPFTINGQYGGQNVPYVENVDGERKIKLGPVIDNGLWLMSHDPNSPLVVWRNRFLDYIIRNNRKSLKLIVLFGTAAKDAAATFVNSAGGEVPTVTSVEDMENIELPESRLVFAGGNNEFPVPLDSEGKDLYSKVLGRRLNYKTDQKTGKSKDQIAAIASILKAQDDYLDKLVLSEGGSFSNGMVHPGQLKGYDLTKMKIKAEGATKATKTISLNGLRLSDGTKIKTDILLVRLPHPTALSRLKTKQEASEKVREALVPLAKFVEKGWRIPHDEKGKTSEFELNNPYNYLRTDIGPEFYDFGAPRSRMVSVSSATRMRKNPHVIVFGQAKGGTFDSDVIQAMTDEEPEALPNESEMYTARPRSKKSRYVFDPGPGPEYAKTMKENLDLDLIFETKEGADFKTDGIDAYYVKTHPAHADFGHYRGTFKNPRVIILADPAGEDDLITARALTGTRGQYLHGLMRDLGVDKEYLVIKTVPFGMDHASDDDWERTLEVTAKYREELFKKLLTGNSDLDLILTDGPWAAREIGELAKGKKYPIARIERKDNEASGLEKVMAQITKLKAFRGTNASLKRADLPRIHLSYYARLWEGTSKDRIVNSSGSDRGLVYAEVAPAWAWTQKLELDAELERPGVEALLGFLKDGKFPLPGESIPDFLKRTGREALMLIPRVVPEQRWGSFSDLRLVG